MSSRPTKAILAVLLTLLVVLQYRLWLSDHGWMKLQDMRGAVRAQQEENKGLQTRNERLHAEVIDLKRGSDALEERARSNLGWVKQGETFYQVIEQKPNTE